METMNENETDRRVTVYDTYADAEYNWTFSYTPGVNHPELKNLTKHCHIQEIPDCEYAYTVEVDGNKFYFYEPGESVIVLTCMLCIMLDNESLKTILGSRSSDRDRAKRIIERYIEREKR